MHEEPCTPLVALVVVLGWVCENWFHKFECRLKKLSTLLIWEGQWNEGVPWKSGLCKVPVHSINDYDCIDSKPCSSASKTGNNSSKPKSFGV